MALERGIRSKPGVAKTGVAPLGSPEIATGIAPLPLPGYQGQKQQEQTNVPGAGGAGAWGSGQSYGGRGAGGKGRGGKGQSGLARKLSNTQGQ